ncbi:MAG: condensation domain-containing protein, partial [Bacilli bacterium]|nr:condensation domain-containing protein [Bacilli bacterium]
PTNDIEKAICNAFSKIFNLKQVGINDDFNLLGGDSIKAIRLVSILNNNHLVVEASQILSLRTPKAICEVISQKEIKVYKPVVGEISLLPIQEYFFSEIKEKDSFNQLYVVKANEKLDLKRLQAAFNKLTNIQDELRASFINHHQIIRPLDTIVTKIKEVKTSKDIKNVIISEVNKSINALNIKDNHLIDIKLINNEYITFVIHHLIIDGVSWSILLDNLASLYKNEEVIRPYPYASFIKDIKKYSKNITNETINKYKAINDSVNEDEIKGHPFNINYSFKSNFDINNPYELSENDFLLLAVSRAYKKTYNRDIIYEMESYGRDESIGEVNQTIGWFTAIYPLLVKVSNTNSYLDIIRDLYNVKKVALDNKHLGIDYLIACYDLKKLKFKHSPITFNFLGDEFAYSNALFKTTNLNNEEKTINAGKANVNEITYGFSLNISKHNNIYSIGGSCASSTYLSNKYQIFLNNIKEETILISKVLKEKIYIYPLYEEPLGVYLDEKVNNKGTAYSCFGYVKLDKSVALDEVKKRINNLLNIHPVLKTRIVDLDGVPYGITDSKVNINIINKDIKDISFNELVKPFDFSKSLTRFYIVKDKDNTYIAYDMHHMISDATSRTLINHELINGIDSNFDLGFIKKAQQGLKNQYSNNLDEAKLFYEKELVDNENIVEPLDDINNSYGGTASIYLGDIKEKLLALANRLSITPNNILTSAFAYTLSRFTNTDNTYFTFTNHGRDLEGLETSLGMYVKTIPVILNTSNQLVDTYLKESSKHILDTMKHSIYPFRLLASQYHISQNISFEYNTNLNDVTGITKDIHYKQDQEKNTSHVSHLSGVINDYQNGYVFSVEHSYKYSKNTAIRFLKTYQKILEGLLTKDNLKDINYTLSEDIKVINKINATETTLKYHDILEAFNNSLKKYPNNTLVNYLDTKYTYSEGAKWINNLTSKLNNVPQGSNIAILTHRSHYYLLTALSVLNHGSAYVPIDDTYPDERIKFMLKDSNAKIVLVTNETINRVKKLTNIPTINVSNITSNGTLKPLKINANEDDTAVILYTSGTT